MAFFFAFLSQVRNRCACAKKCSVILTFTSRKNVHPNYLRASKTRHKSMSAHAPPPHVAAAGETAGSARAGAGALPSWISASSQIRMHDVIFHTLYGTDTHATMEFVRASAIRMHSITQCAFLVSMINTLVQNSDAWSSASSASSARNSRDVDGGSEANATYGSDVVKALFFLLLNVDMVLKEYVCDSGNVKAFGAAMNIRVTGSAAATAARSSHRDGESSAHRRHEAGSASSSTRNSAVELLERMHAWSMLGTQPMNHAKARRFFTVLHDKVVREWLQDQRLHAGDLVRMVKEEYLVC